MVDFRFGVRKHESIALNRPGKKCRLIDLSRRKFLLQYCQGASLAFLPAGLGFPSFNSFPSQQTAAAPVSPPAEATSLGNALIQAWGRGEVDSAEHIRQIVRNSHRPVTYYPDVDEAASGVPHAS